MYKCNKCHYCQEGEPRDIYIAIFTRFCRFLKEFSAGKSPMKMNENVKK